MSIEDNENRNCNCSNENMMPYNMTCNCTCSCECSNKMDQTREEMMEQIKCYNFAVIELGLYLDTHPEDQKALCLHRKYSKELKDKYQKVYGPLTIYYPCNKWRWLEEPWVSFCLEENSINTLLFQ